MMKRKKWSKKALLPVLGFAVLAAAIPGAVSANGEKEGGKGVSVKSVEFVGMPAPATAVQMADLYTTASIKVTYSDGTVKSFPLSYKKLFKTTDKVGNTIAGVAIDAKGNPIMDTSVAGQSVPYVSDDPDSNSLFAVPGAKPTGKGGNPLALVTHYEYITANNSGKSAYGQVPASMSLTTLDQNKTTGELTPVQLKKIDFSGVGGLWIPCNGSLTPWNTHLGSEEYEPDARAFEADKTKTFVGSFSSYYDSSKAENPYAYGFLPEVTVLPDNSTKVVKHYSLGRFSHELGNVAPDMRTVFFGDDGGNTMLFMYVADKAKDLSAGTLYAAKWIQKSAENGGSADLQWIKLGQASDSEIKAIIDKGTKFSDIFETSDAAADGFKAVKVYSSEGNKAEYLKVKPGMEKAAAFLESRRYGAVLGATAEFNKMEGVAINNKDKKVYVAMSYLEKAMEKDSKGADPSDDIQVNKISAGVTYELSLGEEKKDRDGGKIESAYVPYFMKGLVWGEDLPTPDAKGNKAADDKVANPDNLSFSQELRTLFIGEDSGLHANNYVWAYNVDTKKLSRILSLPAGAEATGLMTQDNLNGFSYIMSNIQHPGDEMIVADSLKPEVEKLINQNFENKKSGVIGYIQGVPTKQQMLAAKADETRLVSLGEAVKGGARVFWSHDSDDILLLRETHTLVFRLGAKKATVDGKEVVLSAAPQKVKGQAMLPAALLNDFLRL
ncbi:alkaline phosphatase PhoX [Cohnella soli]|uniref:Alkaline phosphatase PhoX n=1 Tax=Cohnella soli TaxID=425005 RepID=A0ABW0I547_9BACL